MKNIIPILVLLFLTIGCIESKPSDAISVKELDIENAEWWKEAIVYQIYPRSFKDTDGDGVGDLKGIIQKLDYIDDLGVTAVWLNPIYSSPNADNGYDVSDYRGIMDDFGTIEDFDAMLAGMHERDIKLVMDIVVNHSSDEHEWFKQGRSSRDNPYRDYYHWWPAENGKPPHRYSLFASDGEAWRYDKQTDAYYLHYFAAKQPDLNWSNPKLRQEVYDIMKFWAEKGVDGFRLDAFQYTAKDTSWPEFGDDLDDNFIKYYAMQEGIHDYLREMNEEVFSKYDVFSVAEGAGRNMEDAHNIVDRDRKELDMAYAFDAVDIPKKDGYKLSTFKETFTKWDDEFENDGWLSIFLSNHDNSRLVNRYGDPSLEYRAPSTKMLNTFLLSMRGTPYVYFGDELGMTNSDFKTIEDYQDIAAINGFEKVKNQDGDLDLYMEQLAFGSRDHSRTPIHWNDGAQAGFTSGIPWLPVNDNKSSINVEAESNDPNSVLNHFKKLTRLRTNNPVLVYGDYDIVQKEHPKIYAYMRTLADEKLLVLLNFSDTKSSIDFEDIISKLLINNYDTLSVDGHRITLKPWQAVIVKL